MPLTVELYSAAVALFPTLMPPLAVAVLLLTVVQSSGSVPLVA